MVKKRVPIKKKTIHGSNFVLHGSETGPMYNKKNLFGLVQNSEDKNVMVKFQVPSEYWKKDMQDILSYRLVRSPRIINTTIRELTNIAVDGIMESIDDNLYDYGYETDYSYVKERILIPHSHPMYRAINIPKAIQEKADTVVYLTDIKKPIMFSFDKVLFCFAFDFAYTVTGMIEDFIEDEEIDEEVHVHSKYAFMALYKKFCGDITKINSNISRDDITLGLDPEFLFYRQHSGVVNYEEPYPAANILSGRGQLGIENNTLGEFRPLPHINPDVVTDNMRKLIQRLHNEMRQSNTDLFVQVGGGFGDNIGGHIHFGHPVLKDVTYEERKSLVTMLDDFLYYPMKTSMYGAIRKWGEAEAVEEVGNHANTKEIHKALKTQKIRENFSLCYYENNDEDKTRNQKWGLEWRSLPSFIGDEKLTKLTLKLAKEITYRYLKALQIGETIEYEKPPEFADYAKFLEPKEVSELFDYLKGKKRDLFLNDLIKNWNITKELIFRLRLGNTRFFLTDEMRQNFEDNCIKKYTRRFKKEKIDKFVLELLDISSLIERKNIKPTDTNFYLSSKNFTMGKIALDSYGKNTIGRITKNSDMVCTIPHLFSKYFNDIDTLEALVDDLMEIYFTKNADIFNKWEGLFKCFCEGMNTHDKDEKKRQEAARKAYEKAKRRLKKAQEKSSTQDNSLRVSTNNATPGTSISWDNNLVMDRAVGENPTPVPERPTGVRCEICGGIHN